MRRRIIVLLTLAAPFAGGTFWTWSNYCEAYHLCYPACRVASNGVEYWKSLPPVSGKSEWVAAQASPGSECLSLLPVMRTRYPGKQIAIDFVNLANDHKPAPFYQYDCNFDIKEPVFKLARNAKCEPARH